MGGGVFWRLEATSNDLDPDFDRSSLRLSRFFCPNLDDFQKKKLFSWAEAQFFWSKSHQVLAHLSSSIRMGGLFLFLVQKLVSKMLKTGYFAYSSGQWGATAPLPPWLRYWLGPRADMVRLFLVFTKIWQNDVAKIPKEPGAQRNLARE